MQLNKHVTQLGMIASGLAIVQGITWIILCLLGIVIYFGAWTPLTVPGLTHFEHLSNSLTTIFMNQNDVKMIVIVFLYLFLSVMWISFSASVIASLKKKQNNKAKLSFLMWGGCTILICIYDLIVIGLLAADYKATPEINTFLKLSYGILFSIAARGYVLWIINLVLSIFMIKLAMGSKKKNANNVREAIDAFGEERRRSIDMGGNTNAGFEWERPQYNNPHSYAGSSQSGYAKPQTRPIVAPKPETRDHIAKLGKPTGPKNYAHNIPPPKPPTSYIYPTPQYPKIPSPDYSPPNSPLKSALKNRPPQNPFVFNRNTNSRY